MVFTIKQSVILACYFKEQNYIVNVNFLCLMIICTCFKLHTTCYVPNFVYQYQGNCLQRCNKSLKSSNIKSVLKSQHNLFFPFFRGVKRMGQASSDNTGRLTDWSSDAVNRLGELASHGAATIGGLATQASDVALAVPTAISDAALAVPKSLSTFSNDKKMRDCLLQAMCYISTPFIDPNSNYLKRR